MATYEPPTSNLAIFDPTVFQTNNEPLTIEEAKKRFLTFPVAQGTETLLDTTVQGLLTVNNGIKFPTGPNQTYAPVQIFNVMNYGAVGNGIANDTTAIQNCFNACTDYGCIVIPQGKYLITSTITMTSKNYIQIRGEGTIINNNSSLSPILYCFNFTDILGLAITGSLNIISEVPIGLNATLGQGGMIFNNTGSDNMRLLLVEGVKFNNLTIGITLFTSGFSSSRIINNVNIDNCYYGIWNQGEYNRFCNCGVSNSYIGYYSFFAGNNPIIGGDFKFNRIGILIQGGPNTNSDHSVIIGTTVNHNLSCGILLLDIAYSYSIQGCQIWANRTTPLSSLGGLITNTTAQANWFNVYIENSINVLVSGNTFGNNENHLGFSGLKDSLISNNDFVDATFTQNNSIWELGYGSLITANTNITISYNRFSSTNTVKRINWLNSTTNTLTYENVIEKNVGGPRDTLIFDSSTPAGTYYIDGNYDNYIINANTPATVLIYLMPINLGNLVNIQYVNMSLNATQTNYTGVKILFPTISGESSILPQLCDGVFYSTGTPNFITIFKNGTYLFRPLNNGANLGIAGSAYSIYTETKLPKFVFNVTSNTGNVINLTSPAFYNSEVNIPSGMTASTISVAATLSTPNTIYRNNQLKIFNNSENTHTLSTSASFTGEYGNSDATIRLNPNSWVILSPNNTTVDIIDVSREQNFDTINIGGTTNFVLHYNLLNAYVPFNPTVSNPTVQMPVPSADYAQNKYSTVANINLTNSLTLSISSGVFNGLFGSGSTSITIPPNSWIKINSDGTDWNIIQRSQNINYLLYSASTSFDWSTNYQYLDTQVELVPADDALNTSANITGGGYLIGYTIDFPSLSGTGFGAGSVFSFNANPTRKYTILAQLSGNLGGLGKYLINFAGTIGSVGSPLAITMRPNLTTNSNGNLTQGALTTQTGIYSTATFTTGTPFAGMTVGLASATVMGNIPFYVINQNSGTIWNVSSNSTGVLGSTAWFGNRGNTINLPAPANAFGRTFTLINNSGTMTNITTVAGTALFAGRYGQMILNTSTVASNYPVGAFPTNYLLRPNQTVVLKSDGTQWETQDGTTLGEQKMYFNNIAFTTSTGDGTFFTYPLYNYDQTYSNLSGLINITDGSSPAWCNLYPFPITVQLTFSFTWTSVAVAGTVLPSRIVNVIVYGAGITGFVGTNSNTITAPCTVASPNFTTALGDIMQSYTATVTLRSFELFVVQVAKRDGSGTGRVLGVSTMFIKRLA